MIEASIERLEKTRDLCFAYNQILPSDNQKRIDFLKDLLSELGENSIIQSPFFCDIGKNIRLGHDVFINYNCTFLDCGEIVIGDHVMIGPGCGLYPVSHPLDPVLRRSWETSNPSIIIEDDVWMGGNCTVLPGVTIGRGAVIGAGSVVTKDVPAMTAVAGNPAKEIRKIEENE